MRGKAETAECMEAIKLASLLDTSEKHRRAPLLTRWKTRAETQG